MRRTNAALLISMAIILAACSGGDAGAELLAGSVGDDSTHSQSDEATAPMDVALDVQEGRQVVRRASLELRADDTRAAFDRIVAMVQEIGGFVADANVYPTTSDEAEPQVTMTLRVPEDQLNETLDAIKGSVDEVVSETQGAEDVTEEFVDLEARLTNLEALETELRALLQETRMKADADPDAILRVFDEVASVRGQIEQLQGRLDYLSDLTALATVQVGITQTPSAAPLVDVPWDPGATVREATGNLVSGLQGAADWLINFGLFALPMLLIVLGPLAIVGAIVYKRFFRRPTGSAPIGT
ncbi:MAG: DUF4349 domain-containing protein [Acidimicrobiia bacterium]